MALAPGDTVLLLLASANRDEAANPEPDVFDPARRDPVLHTFSEGAHRCPGAGIAVAIATGMIAGLSEVGFSPARIALDRLAYLPSANARIPVISGGW